MSLAALKRPFGTKALLGILIVWIPIIEFFTVGYRMACARTAMSGRYELPAWKGSWKQFFMFGLGVRILQILYILPVALAMYALYLVSKSPITTVVAFMGMIRNLLVVFLVLIVISAFLGPASILNYVAEGRFKAAFSFNVLRRAASWAYLKGWGIAAIYTAIIAGIFFAIIFEVGLTASVTLAYMTVPAIFILFFLPGITIWTLLGEAWGKSIAREYRPNL